MLNSSHLAGAGAPPRPFVYCRGQVATASIWTVIVLLASLCPIINAHFVTHRYVEYNVEMITPSGNPDDGFVECPEGPLEHPFELKSRDWGYAKVFCCCCNLSLYNLHYAISSLSTLCDCKAFKQSVLCQDLLADQMTIRLQVLLFFQFC